MKQKTLTLSGEVAKWAKRVACTVVAASTLAFMGSAAHADTTTPSPVNSSTTQSVDTVNLLTPLPYSVAKIKEAPFTISQNMCVHLSSPQLQPAVNILNERLSKAYGIELQSSTTQTCPITFTEVDHIAMPHKDLSPQQVPFSFDQKEAYSLDVHHDSINVSSTSIRGAIWASQSIIQLIGPWAFSQYRLADAPTVPAVNIMDAPRYEYRGFMLDPSRSFYPVDEVKRIIDMMSYAKLNVLHLHLSDNQGFRIAIDNKGREPGDTIDYSLLTKISGTTAFNAGWSKFNPAPGRSGYYTKDQFIDLVKYAALHGVGVIAEIDGPGHSTAMLHAIEQLNTADSTPKPDAGRNTIDLTKQNWGFVSLATQAPVTYTFMKHVIGEITSDIAQGVQESGVPDVAENYFHMGGDEVKLPANTPHRAEVTQRAMQTYLGKVAQIVSDDHKTPIVWNDGLAAANQLPEGSVVQVWVGHPDGQGGRVQKFVKARHGKVIMSVTKRSYLVQKPAPEVVAPAYACDKATGCTTRDYYNWDPTADAKVTENDMLGTETAIWTEHLRTLHDTEFMMYPRFFANAEVAWSQQALRNYDTWKTKVSALGIALINNGNTFQLTTNKEIPNWHGEYRANYALNVKPNSLVRVGTIAQPGLTGVDGIHLQAAFTDAASKKVTNLPVTVTLARAFHYQDPNESKDRWMNSVAAVMVQVPQELAGHSGKLMVTGSTPDSSRGTIALVPPLTIAQQSDMSVQALPETTPTTPVTPPVVQPTPITPVKPEPVAPTPAVPTQPVQPVAPSQPVAPAQPVTPAKPAPVAPENPVTPAKPTKPAEQTKPVSPVTPVKPVQPSESVQPVKPVTSAPDQSKDHSVPASGMHKDVVKSEIKKVHKQDPHKKFLQMKTTVKVEKKQLAHTGSSLFEVSLLTVMTLSAAGAVVALKKKV